jgi:hypothetical protein
MEVEAQVSSTEDKNSNLPNSTTKESVIDDELDLIAVKSTNTERTIYTGNLYTFFYYQGYPLFTIGPDCIFILMSKGNTLQF